MLRIWFPLRVLALLLLWLAQNSAAAQKPAPPPSASISANADMADRVRREFLHAWEGYKKYSWGHDELKPLTKSYHDWYQKPLLMTPVDALDTMILMNLKPQADEARELIRSRLSFDQDIYVKNFEITIRLLGGLLSGYQ
jgi:ER degradation enhancer, mannosidase alpha-like 2